MDSSDRAISPFDAQNLLKNAGMDDSGVTIPGILEQIMVEMKSDIKKMGSQGFTRRAMSIKGNPEYIWAHTTAPGIIWLWAQQEDKDTRDRWLSEPKENWEDFDFKEPSPDSPMRWPSTSASASRASAAGVRGDGVEYGLSESIPPSSITAPFVPSAYPPLSPGSSYSPGGGYRKRKMRKTRRKSSRRGRSRSRSRSRSRQIRRKKTHHRRHRR